jgi:hypothetical protein
MVISIEPIPEASRLQRRGRVGRMASGDVYYTYKKKSRAHIKPRYGIVTSDVTFDLYNMLNDFLDISENKIFDYEYHPCNYIYYNKRNEKTLLFKEFILKETNTIVRKIYEEQFYINVINENKEYQSIINEKINPYHSIKQILYSGYKNGYNLYNILDHDGIFYLIHPSEENFKRNAVTGKIIYDNKLKIKIDKYISKKITNSITKLQNIKYIYFDKVIQYPETEYMYLHKFKYHLLIDNIILKESDKLGFLMKTTSLDEIIKIIKTICISTCYDSTDDIIKILSLIS